MRDTGPWATRVTWVLVPLLAGPLLGSALHPTSDVFRTSVTVGLWAGWLVAFVASLVPRAATLTVLRVVVPTAVPATLWAAVAVPDGTPAWQAPAGLVVAVVAASTALSSLTTEPFVDGSSYGSERRFGLRLPAPLLLLAPASWAVGVAGACAGPLLLAAGVPVAGVAALVVGWPAAVAAIRALHQLARRWVVFVPAGFVLHDPLTLADPVLFPRRTVARLGPAVEGEAALDLTGAAPGLVLAAELVDPVAVTVRGRAGTGTVEAPRVLFTPVRPGALLEEAAGRRVAVG